MIKLKVVYTDNSTGQFYCEKTHYDARAVSFVTTDDEFITIPYYNVFIIREQEVKDDGSVRSD